MGIRKIIICLLSIYCGLANAQKVIPFLGLGLNRNIAFIENSYVNVASGIQFNMDEYSKPEIELRFFYGLLRENSTYDFGNVVTKLKDVSTQFQAFNWNITPNFIFTQKENTTWFWVVKPKFNYATIKATDYITEYRDSNTIRTKVVREGISRAFGINIGLLGKTNSDTFDSILMSFFTDNINFDKVIRTPENKDDVYTKYDLGFELTFYFKVNTKNR